LLQPMPTAMKAEMIQTVMSVPETILELQIKDDEVGREKLEHGRVDGFMLFYGNYER
jgi:hypothetical protein